MQYAHKPPTFCKEGLTLLVELDKSEEKKPQNKFEPDFQLKV